MIYRRPALYKRAVLQLNQEVMILRRSAAILGNALGVNIVRKGSTVFLLEREHLQRVFREFAVDCVFDVGANAGQYASRLRALGFGGYIISFEPIPELAATLRRTAARDPKWFIEEVALDNAVRRVDFNLMADSQFSSLKAPDHTNTDQFRTENVVSRTVSITTGVLDSFFLQYRERFKFRRPFLKMDTQGNDLAVAHGAVESLPHFIGLQSELSIKHIYVDDVDFRDGIDFYREMGFDVSALVPNNAGHFPLLVDVDCILLNRAYLTEKTRFKKLLTQEPQERD